MRDNQFDLALQSNNAIRVNQANATPPQYNSMITEAGNTRHFNKAWIAYTNAITAWVANAPSRNSVAPVTAAATAVGGASGGEELTGRDTNEVTNASTITAVGNNQGIDLNTNAYEEDMEMNQQHNFRSHNPNSLFSSTNATPSRNTGITEPDVNNSKRPQQ